MIVSSVTRARSAVSTLSAIEHAERCAAKAPVLRSPGPTLNRTRSMPRTSTQTLRRGRRSRRSRKLSVVSVCSTPPSATTTVSVATGAAAAAMACLASRDVWSSPENSFLLKAVTFLDACFQTLLECSAVSMPRSTLRGNGAPLMALSDGLNERALRAAANRESQQEQVEPASQAADHVNVGGIVFNAFAHAAQAAAAAVGEEGAAGDDGAGDTEEQRSPLEADAGDVFDFPAGADLDARADEHGEEDDDDDGVHIDEAHVDGQMAAEEDAREHQAAEAAVEEEGEAVILPARVVHNQGPCVRFAPGFGGRGKVARGKGGRGKIAPGIPVRRRKVLRDNIQCAPPLPLSTSLATSH